MRRRHCPRSEPPPVVAPKVPDVVRDKGVKLSRAQRRAHKERQMSFESIESYPQYAADQEDALPRDSRTFGGGGL